MGKICQQLLSSILSGLLKLPSSVHLLLVLSLISIALTFVVYRELLHS